MAVSCNICGKTTVVGRSQKHKRGIAGKRWRNRAPSTRRVFKPNLNMVSVKVGDEKAEQMRLCGKCIKRIKKFGEIKPYSNISLV